jgi:protein-L-isoaspartate(D-aspartate) O-methyltransferase
VRRNVLPLALALGFAAPTPSAAIDTTVTTAMRARLVQSVRTSGIGDERVLTALGSVPRHLFVPDARRDDAYVDRPLPIGHEQTISQPFVVALMTQLAHLTPPCRVLEVGTGSGYQAAVLDALGCEVFSIEIVEPLATEARDRLARLGYARVHVRAGDGYRGWPDEAPFDAVLVTAAPPEVPQPLLDHLRVGGRLVAPVGPEHGEQRLVVIERDEAGFARRTSVPVRFVPMTGEAQAR